MTVVAHSMGGIAVSAAAHQADRLVFVTAAMPGEGEAPAGMLAEMVFPAALDAARFAADGSFSFTERIADLVCQDSPDERRRDLLARLRPSGTAFPAEPAVSPAWMTVPSAYVVCRNDRCCRPDWQRERAALAGESIELDADHCPFYSAPGELSAFLIAQADKAAEPAGRDRQS